MALFDSESFVASCVEARAQADPVPALREVMARAVSQPDVLRAAFPVPIDPADDGILFRSDSLFVTQAAFPRGFATGIHDHTVTAVIGVYAGYEDNRLFRRAGSGIEPVEVRRVDAGDVLVLSADAVHDVHAPAGTWTAALHVYLGDITALERSEWASIHASEQPLDGAEMEARWMAAATATGLVHGG